MQTPTTLIFRAIAVGLLLGAALGRGWGLWHRGLLEHDEGHALLNANTWWHVMRWVLSGGPLSADGTNSIAVLRDTLHQQGGTLDSAGKLGYSLLVAAVGQLSHVSTNLAMLLAWLGGILVAALAGGVTWQYTRSHVAAWVAAFGCMTSPLLTDVSREASGTIYAVGFGLAGLWMIQQGLLAERRRARQGWQITGGAMLAYGFLCHFNLAPFILAIFAASGFMASARGPATLTTRVRSALSGIMPAAIGALGGLALAELVTRIADVVLARSYPEYRPLSGELYYLFFRDQAPMLDGQLFSDGAIGWSREAWAVYGRALWNEGPIWILLLTASLIVAASLWAKLRQHGSIQNAPIQIAPAAALLLIPALFWAAYIYRVERSLAMCMAASWIFIAVAVASILPGWQRRLAAKINPNSSSRPILITATAALIALQITHAAFAWRHDVRQKSPLRPMVQQTFKHPLAQGRTVTAGSFDVSFAPIWKWTILEEQRHHATSQPAVQPGPVVDFSRFSGAEIIFIDPFTWNRPTPDFSITPEQADSGHVLAELHTTNPPWKLKSVLLMPR